MLFHWWCITALNIFDHGVSPYARVGRLRFCDVNRSEAKQTLGVPLRADRHPFLDLSVGPKGKVALGIRHGCAGSGESLRSAIVVR